MSSNIGTDKFANYSSPQPGPYHVRLRPAFVSRQPAILSFVFATCKFGRLGDVLVRSDVQACDVATKMSLD